jgi:Putative sensor
MNPNTMDDMTLADAVIHFFTAPLRLRTYTNLLYLLLAFPLGLIYFVFLTVGLTTGFGLVIVWIGIPILAMVLAGSWGLAALERQLAIHALGAEVPPMLPRIAPPAAGFWQGIGAFLSNPVTWKGMAFLLLKFPLGIVSFIAIVTMLATSAGFMLAPAAWYFGDFSSDNYIDMWLVDSAASAWAVGLLGVFFLFVSLNLLNGLAQLWRWTATFLLGSERFVPAAPAPPALPEPAAA